MDIEQKRELCLTFSVSNRIAGTEEKRLDCQLEWNGDDEGKSQKNFRIWPFTLRIPLSYEEISPSSSSSSSSTPIKYHKIVSEKVDFKFMFAPLDEYKTLSFPVRAMVNTDGVIPFMEFIGLEATENSWFDELIFTVYSRFYTETELDKFKRQYVVGANTVDRDNIFVRIQEKMKQEVFSQFPSAEFNAAYPAEALSPADSTQLREQSREERFQYPEESNRNPSRPFLSHELSYDLCPGGIWVRCPPASPITPAIEKVVLPMVPKEEKILESDDESQKTILPELTIPIEERGELLIGEGSILGHSDKPKSPDTVIGTPVRKLLEAQACKAGHKVLGKIKTTVDRALQCVPLLTRPPLKRDSAHPKAVHVPESQDSSGALGNRAAEEFYFTSPPVDYRSWGEDDNLPCNSCVMWTPQCINSRSKMCTPSSDSPSLLSVHWKKMRACIQDQIANLKAYDGRQNTNDE